MKALIYSDLQATDGHERCFTQPSVSLQLWRVGRFYDELRKIYDEHKCDALWDLGDTTDDRSAIPVPVIDLLCDKLESFAGDCNIKLEGNHEQWLRSPEISAGKMLRRYFHVVNGCERFECANVNILCANFHDDTQVIVDFLKKHQRRRPTVLLGHFQVSGCQMNSGRAVGGVPVEAMDFVNIALLGHIHKPQSMGSAHYIGSPFQQHWGEAGEPSRVAILNFEGDDIEVQWIPMVGFPVYRHVSLQQFIECVKEESEDRFKVTVRSIAETEQYYAHPLANRADEVIYAYESGPAVSVAADGEAALPTTKTDTLLRYMGLNPPDKHGVSLTAQDMLGFGEEICA